MSARPLPLAGDGAFVLYHDDALRALNWLPDRSARACVTSPPYIDVRPEYPSPSIDEFALIFRELRRVVTDACLVNVGRTWRDGAESLWWLDLLAAAREGDWRHLDTRVWIKPNANPIHGQIFADRHEYVLVLGREGCRLNTDAVRVPYAASSVARMERGWTNHVSVKGGGRADRVSKPNPLGGRGPSYFEATTGGEKGIEHPSPMPRATAAMMVKLASWPGDVVVDPFVGSGTTALACMALGRRCVGIEVEERYCLEALARTSQQPLLTEET